VRPKSQHLVVVRQRALQVGNLQMHRAYVRAAGQAKRRRRYPVR
jgi:hypothetical protein